MATRAAGNRCNGHPVTPMTHPPATRLDSGHIEPYSGVKGGRGTALGVEETTSRETEPLEIICCNLVKNLADI